MLAAAGSLFALSSPLAADPLAALKNTYEGVRTRGSEGRVTMLYGAPMTVGATPDEAADLFWRDHGQIFRGTQPEVNRRFGAKPKESPLTIIAYDQNIRGVPVVNSTARVVTREVAGQQRVVFVSARLAGEPTIGSEVPLVPAEVAILQVLSQPGYGDLTAVGEPRLVVLPGWAARGDAWVWAVDAIRQDRNDYEPRTFYIDTALGQLLKVQKNWVASGPNHVAGAVHGWVTPGTEPYTTANSPVLVTLPAVRVGWSELGAGSWHDDWTPHDGSFSFNIGTHQSVDLRSTLGPSIDTGSFRYFVKSSMPCQPPWWCDLPATAATVQEQAGANSVTDLVFGDTSQSTVAQMNVVHHLEQAKNYVLDRVDFDEDILHHTLRVVVNYCSGWGCNAYYRWATPGCYDDRRTLQFFGGGFF